MNPLFNVAPQRHPASIFEPEFFTPLPPSFSTCRILRRVGSAIAWRARSRDVSVDIGKLRIPRESMPVNVRNVGADGNLVPPAGVQSSTPNRVSSDPKQ